MKILSLAVAVCFSVLSFNAFAGGNGNCLYGHDAKIAGADDLLDKAGMEGETDPRLLALLKKQKEDDAKVAPFGTYN